MPLMDENDQARHTRIWDKIKNYGRKKPLNAKTLEGSGECSLSSTAAQGSSPSHGGPFIADFTIGGVACSSEIPSSSTTATSRPSQPPTAPADSRPMTEQSISALEDRSIEKKAKSAGTAPSETAGVCDLVDRVNHDASL